MTNSKIKKLVILTLVIIIYSSCVFDEADTKLKMINNTDRNFYPILKNNRFFILRDTLKINQNPEYSFLKKGKIIYPLFAFKNHGGYVKEINESCADSTLFIYLFEVDTVKKYGWNVVLNNKEFQFSKGYKVSDLDKINWNVYLSKIFQPQKVQIDSLKKEL